MDHKISVISLTPELTCAAVKIEEMLPAVPMQHIDTLVIQVNQKRETGSDIDEEDIKYDVAKRIHSENVAEIQKKPSLYAKSLTSEATLVIEVNQKREIASEIDGDDIKYDVSKGIHKQNVAQVQNNPSLYAKSLTPKATNPVHIEELLPAVPTLDIEVKQEKEDGSDIDDIKYDVPEGIHNKNVSQVQTNPSLNVKKSKPGTICTPMKIEWVTRGQSDTLVIKVKQEKVDASDKDEDEIKYNVAEGIGNENVAQVQNNPSLYLKTVATCSPLQIDDLAQPVQMQHIDPLKIEAKLEGKDGSGINENIESDEGIHRQNIAQVHNNPLSNSYIEKLFYSSVKKYPGVSIKPLKCLRVVVFKVNIVQQIQNHNESKKELENDSNYLSDCAKERLNITHTNSVQQHAVEKTCVRRGMIHSEKKSEIVSDNNLNLYICDCCSSKFSSKQLLIQHITKAKNKICTATSSLKSYNETLLCERSNQSKFSKKRKKDNRHLNRHQKMYTEEKPHECAVCKISFRQKVHLNQHLIIHTGDKPYQCSVCKKRFNKKSNLNSHLKIHIGEKSYQCSVCDKGFRRNSDLKKHQNIHTGHKPYQCSVCNKKFNQRVHLIIHLRIHTGDRPYRCSVCDKRFSWKSYLNKHLKRHNRDKQQPKR